MSEPNNDMRASWGYDALKLFAKNVSNYDLPATHSEATEEDKECIEEALGDLLADLLHLADKLEVGANALMERAANCYAEEVAIEAQEGKFAP